MLFMSKKLISDEIVEAYAKRLETMNKYKFTEEGDKLFITTMVVETNQVENLYIQSKVGDLIIENDAPKDLGGSGSLPTAMQSLLASLANCMELSALIYFSIENVQVNSIKVKVEGTYDKRSVLNTKKSPLPGFYDYKITWYIESNENLDKIKQVLKQVENKCPVRGSFERPKKFSEEIVLI